MNYMMRYNSILFTFLFSILLTDIMIGQVAQINVPRIEQMPNQPSPYNVRDWREVAVQYDNFVYDVNKTGQYLPLITLKNNGTNYPQNPGFELVTYVGTNRTSSNEAINVLPSLVGATLVGVDKTNHYGQNWVLMSQDFFNKNNGHLIYLNGVSSGSGGDWWYDLMPNVFFYQLYDLYPNIGDYEFQFTSVADRFAQSVRALGGNDAPWSPAFMNYRAFDFLTMQPNPNGVKEPEAAGAYAWVLYHAYKKTGNPEYLKAAEWSIEFLNEWNTNPSYELQLPYGTCVAAKMNAELGTNYDIEKMVNWSFDRGFLRGWGTIVGRWNGFDVSGLVGEANDNGNDYAFQLNGVQQAAALAPMLRYDKRFARAIGKWILNLANATRLFYPGFLPGFLQDASGWSDANDPNRVIGYEALREKWEGKSPFSTGDALRGGWAETNLALYGTSSIGYLGAMLEKTNVDKILKIDLLKTDFFRDAAYPTYLFYNPYNTAQTVQFSVGEELVDIYETLSESFLQNGVNGTIELTIPADAAIIVVLAPAGGAITFDQNRMRIDGVVVDYMQTANVFNYKPRIQALGAVRTEVETGDSVRVFAKAFDQDSENLTYVWSASGGTISGTGAEIFWHAEDAEGDYEIQVMVSDENDQRDTAVLELKIVAEINQAPEILEISKGEGYVAPGGELALSVSATDANEDPLTYAWTVTGGTITGTGNTVSWMAPSTEGVYEITVTVRDDKNASAQASTTILVKDFAATTGDLIAYYPFSGNADDASGNNLHGSVFGARLNTDQFGNANSAYFFDGVNDRISVPSASILNVEDAITVSTWFNADQLPDRESFIISHGSWQNRWKISIIPERRIRWTINSTSTIRDLDSDLNLEEDRFYHVAATYDGKLMLLYLNGKLQSYKELSGKIRKTSLDFLIGQMLPGDANYNFRGVIDEVKVFNYALTPEAVENLYNESLTTSVENINNQQYTINLMPNPVREKLNVRFSELPDAAVISIYNINGQRIATRAVVPGTQIIEIDASSWKTGFYLITITTQHMNSTTRFVKQ